MATVVSPKSAVPEIPDDQRDGFDRMEDTLSSLAHLTGAISDELHKVYVTELISPEPEPPSDSEDESYDYSVGSDESDDDDDEDYDYSSDESVENRTPSRRRGSTGRRSRSRSRRRESSTMRRSRSKKAARAARRAKREAAAGGASTKKGGVRKIKKMLSRGIKSSMSIGSRTSKTSKTKATVSGSSNEQQSPARKIEVVSNIHKVKDDLQKKKKWGLKLRSSKGKIPRTINADGDSCSSVSVLEEPVKATSKSFDDVLDEFLLNSGLSGLMNMFSSPAKEEGAEQDDKPFVFCQDVGCQGVGCQGKGNVVDELQFHDDELDNADAVLSEPVTQTGRSAPPEVFDSHTQRLEEMLNMLAMTELNMTQKAEEVEADPQDKDVTPAEAEETEQAGMLSLAKSFDDLLHTISKIEIPSPMDITRADFTIQNSAPEESNSIANSEEEGPPLPTITVVTPGSSRRELDGSIPLPVIDAFNGLPTGADNPVNRGKSLMDEDKKKTWKRLRTLKKLLSWKGASLSNFAEKEKHTDEAEADELEKEPEQTELDEPEQKPEQAELVESEQKPENFHLDEMKKETNEAELDESEMRLNSAGPEELAMDLNAAGPEEWTDAEADAGNSDEPVETDGEGTDFDENNAPDEGIETRIKEATATSPETAETLISTTGDDYPDTHSEGTEESDFGATTALEVDLAPDQSVVLFANGVPLNELEQEEGQDEEDQPNALEVGLSSDLSVVLLKDGSILNQLSEEDAGLKLTNINKEEVEDKCHEAEEPKIDVSIEEKTSDLEKENSMIHVGSIQLDETKSERRVNKSRTSKRSKEASSVANEEQPKKDRTTKTPRSTKSASVAVDAQPKKDKAKKTMLKAKASSVTDDAQPKADKAKKEKSSKAETRVDMAEHQKKTTSSIFASYVDATEQPASGDTVVSLLQRFSNVRALRKLRVVEKKSENRFSFIRSSKAKTSRSNLDPPDVEEKPSLQRGMDPPLANEESAPPSPLIQLENHADKQTGRRSFLTDKQKRQQKQRLDPEPASQKPADPEGNTVGSALLAPEHVQVDRRSERVKAAEPEPSPKKKVEQKEAKPQVKPEGSAVSSQLSKPKTSQHQAGALSPSKRQVKNSKPSNSVAKKAPRNSITDSHALTRSMSREAGSVYGGMPLDVPRSKDVNPVPKMATESILSDLSELSVSLKLDDKKSRSGVSTISEPHTTSSSVLEYSNDLFPKDTFSMMEEQLSEEPRWEADFKSDFNKF